MSTTRICWWAKGSTSRSDIPLSPLALMAAGPSAKAFFTNATTSALVLKSDRLGSSSWGIGLPMVGVVYQVFWVCAVGDCAGEGIVAGVGGVVVLFSWICF